jgi:hypothetical protein
MSFTERDESLDGYVTPANLKYSNVLPVGVPSSTSIRRFNPNNGATFRYDQTGTIRIPIAASGQFLSPQESYVQFSVTNNGVSDIELQSSAYSFFERYRLAGPLDNDIDRMNEFAPLMSLISDVQLSKTYRNTTGAISAGYGSMEFIASNPVKAEAADYRIAVQEIRDGHTRNIPVNGTEVFTIPLLGLLGQSKYLPLSHIAAPGLTIELTLAKFNDAVVSAAAPNFTISNVNYVATMITFDPRFLARFDQVLAMGPIQIHSPTWHHFPSTQATASYVMDVPERSNSIKSMFAIQRNVALVNSAVTTENRVDVRSKSGMLSYQWRVGSEQYPQRPVVCSDPGSVDVYAEGLKAFGMSLHSIENSGSVIDVDTWEQDGYYAGKAATLAPNSAAYTANPETYRAEGKQLGKYFIGIDLESYSGSNIESGLNNKNNALPISLDVGRDGTGLPIRVDVYTHVDSIVSLTLDGMITVDK